MFVCDNCLKEFSQISNLAVHKKSETPCQKVILNSDGTIQNKQPLQCNDCYAILSNKTNFERHLLNCKKAIERRRNQPIIMQNMIDELNMKYDTLRKEFEDYVRKVMGATANYNMHNSKYSILGSNNTMNNANTTNNTTNNNTTNNNNTANNTITIGVNNYRNSPYLILSPPIDFLEIDSEFITFRNIHLFASIKSPNIDAFDDDISDVIIYRFNSDHLPTDENKLRWKPVWSNYETHAIHYYRNSKWHTFNDEEKFRVEFIVKIINQCIEPIKKLCELLYWFINMDISRMDENRLSYSSNKILNKDIYLDMKPIYNLYDSFMKSASDIRNGDTRSILITKFKETYAFKNLYASMENKLININNNKFKPYKEILNKLRDENYSKKILIKFKEIKAKYDPVNYGSVMKKLIMNTENNALIDDYNNNAPIPVRAAS